MKLGDHLLFDRGPYDHHAIYIGNGQVIHFAAPEGQDFEAAVLIGRESAINIVHKAPLERVSEGKPFTVVEWNPDDCYPPLKVVARAHSRLGQGHYTLYQDNCEHFARWCKAGRHESLQVERMREKAVKVVDVAAHIVPRLAERVRQEISVSADAAAATGAPASSAPAAGPASADGGGTSGASPPPSSLYAEFAQHLAELWGAHASALKGSHLRCPAHGPGHSHVPGHGNDHSNVPGPSRRLPAGAVLPDKTDQFLLLAYHGALLWGRSKNDWLVTERAVVWPGGELYLSCHEIADIRAERGSLVITDLDGYEHRLPAAFLHPESVAAFLTAAIAGTQPAGPLQAPGFSAWLTDFWRALTRG